MISFGRTDDAFLEAQVCFLSLNAQRYDYASDIQVVMCGAEIERSENESIHRIWEA